MTEGSVVIHIDIDDTAAIGKINGLKAGLKELEKQESELPAALENGFAGAIGSLNTLLNSSLGASIGAGAAGAITQALNKVLGTMEASFKAAFTSFNRLIATLNTQSIGGTRLNLSTVTLPSIPRLAKGAVIPSNNEFLAVLGDQKQGTNIEAPLDTIVSAVTGALNQSGMNAGSIGAAVRQSLSGLSLKVDKRELGYIAADSINENRRAAGQMGLNL